MSTQPRGVDTMSECPTWTSTSQHHTQAIRRPCTHLHNAQRRRSSLARPVAKLRLTVPDLSLDRLAIDTDASGSELDTDCKR